jgi:hypothetical protein
MSAAGTEADEPQGDGEASSAEPDWGSLVIAACGGRPAPRSAMRHDGGIGTATKPQKFTCDDNRLYAVKFVQNQHGDGRGVATEQFIGLLGELIGAPVAPVELVEVPQALTDELLRDRAAHYLDFDPAPGVHHGSRWAADHSERAAVDHVDANRESFGALDVLYTWATCSGDQQFIYSNAAPHTVLSVDHTLFLPGGFGWSAATLAAAKAALTQDATLAPFGLTPEDRAEALGKLGALTPASLAEVVARPPDSWGVTMQDRVALAEFLWERKDPVLTMLS